ncbi:MAG TPA: YeeE/YedE thiosulfate transporter family protein [Dongiaceae bacterium]|nr:YeeE/YedE thiosulfate transporter family protein [Dongiaceae bacterium]
MSPNFTPFSALAGGALIGLAAALLWLALGRIAGISGILGQALRGATGAERAWRILFLAGLPLGAWLAVSLGWTTIPTSPPASLVLAIAGGLLVGFGTRLGGGCTSGHGVCGLARLSPRSLVATALFMAAGVATTVALRHLIG